MIDNKFTRVHQFFVPEINCEIQQYTHEATKATHYHIHPLKPFNDENSFSVILKTMPSDSTGVAHILEHTVLCGSREFPIKAPFFKMLGRSAATFMNAMTGSDQTYYPFATQNKKDFDNLLQVYLDSVFHANIDEADFLQEGWRYEFEDNDTTKDLMYKGVVLNEMKGAMSSEIREVYQNLRSNLFKDTVYRHNSGGAPLDIPKLSYAQLKSFYERYYHPSNSVIFTYGTIPAEAHHAQFCKKLSGFTYRPVDISEREFVESADYNSTHSKKSMSHYSAKIDPAGDNQLYLSWMCGDSTNLQESYEMNIFSQMLQSSESELQKHLDVNQILLSDLNGFFSYDRQTHYTLGVKKLKNDEIDKVRDEILEKLSEVKNQSFSKEKMHSILDNIELDVKEQKSHSSPYSLELIEAIQGHAVAGKNIEEVFDIAPTFKAIREKIDNATLMSSIFEKYINASRMKEVVSVPDSTLTDKAQATEKNSLIEAKASMSEAEKAMVVEKAKSLALSQNAVQDVEILPRLLRSDIDPVIDWGLFSEPVIEKDTIHYENNSGVSYVSIYMDLPVSEQNAYNSVLREVYYAMVNEYCSFAGLSLEESDIERAKNVVDYHVGQEMYKKIKNPDKFLEAEHQMHLVVGGKNLETKSLGLMDTLCKSFFEAEFNDIDKMKFIASEIVNYLKNFNDLGVRIIHEALAHDIDAVSAVSYKDCAPSNLAEKVKIVEHILASPEAAEKMMRDLSAYHERLIAHNKVVSPVLKLVCGAASKEMLKNRFEHHANHYLGSDDEHKEDQNVKGVPSDNRLATPQTSKKTYPQFRGSVAPTEVMKTMETLNQPYNCTAFYNEIQSSLNQKEFKPKKLAVLGPGEVAHNFKCYRLDEATFAEITALNVGCSILASEHLHRLIREQGGAYGSGARVQDNMLVLSSYRDPKVLGTYSNFDAAVSNLMNNSISERLIEQNVIKVVANINKLNKTYDTPLTIDHFNL